MKYLSQAEFARRIGRSRVRVGQLLKAKRIKCRLRAVRLIEIPESEVINFKRKQRPAGRPAKV